MDYRICVAVAHLKLFLEVSYLLHMGKLGDLLEFLHPMLDWLAVLLLNRGEIRSRSSYFLFSHE